MNNCGTGAKKFVVSFPRDCHAYAHNDKYFRLRPKRKLIRSVLINGLCNFEDEIGAARRRPYRTPSLTTSTSDCAVLLRSRRIKRGGIISERHLSMRVLSVVPRYAVTVGSLARGER